MCYNISVVFHCRLHVRRQVQGQQTVHAMKDGVGMERVVTLKQHVGTMLIVINMLNVYLLLQERYIYQLSLK